MLLYAMLLPSLTPLSPQRQQIKQSIRIVINNIEWHEQCVKNCEEQIKQHNFHSPEWFSFDELRIKSINKKMAEKNCRSLWRKMVFISAVFFSIIG